MVSSELKLFLESTESAAIRQLANGIITMAGQFYPISVQPGTEPDMCFFHSVNEIYEVRMLLANRKVPRTAKVAVLRPRILNPFPMSFAEIPLKPLPTADCTQPDLIPPMISETKPPIELLIISQYSDDIHKLPTHTDGQNFYAIGQRSETPLKLILISPTKVISGLLIENYSQYNLARLITLPLR